MKCLVCGHEHTGNVCPVCEFPVVEIPGSDYEAGLKKLMPTIEKYKSDFHKKVTLTLVGYRYNAADKITFAGEETFKLGTVDKLSRSEKWVDIDFTNIESRKTIPITLKASVGSKPLREITVEMNNIPSEKLRFGVSLDKELCLRCMIRDGSGKTVSSEAVPVVN